MFSQTVIYALRAMGYIAAQRAQHPVLAKRIATEMDIPQNFLSKILNRLVQAGFIRSTRGTGGGFTLARPARDIKLGDVVTIFDNMANYQHCLLGLQSRGGCGLHEKWLGIAHQMNQFLEETSIAEIWASPGQGCPCEQMHQAKESEHTPD
jgi:Rrf2 family protein